MFGIENLPGFLPSLFWGIITISLLVFIHEAGHYLAARALGLKVTEFFIGLPGPSISFKRGDTRFGITCIPLGGYVRIPALEGSGPAAELGVMTEEERKEYDKIPAWKRVVVLLAGVVTNLIFAIAVLTALFSYTGIPSNSIDPIEGGPAYTAGIPEGVHFTAVDDQKVEGFQEFTQAIAGREVGDTITLSFKTSEGITQSRDVTLAPRSEVFPNDPDGFVASNPDAPSVGVTISMENEAVSVGRAFTYSFEFIVMVAEVISRFFSPETFPEAVSEASSIIGISVIAAHTADAGFISYISLLALISISLGLMNLLPIPPLDGGKIMFEIIQKVIGRPVPEQLYVGVSLAGFALLIIFMIYLMGQDLFRIFG